MCSGMYTSMNMSQEPKPRLKEQEDSQGQPANKKAYQKPGFRYERVFETTALACSKLPGKMRCGTRGGKQS
jgi:hypothetical protein